MLCLFLQIYGKIDGQAACSRQKNDTGTGIQLPAERAAPPPGDLP